MLEGLDQIDWSRLGHAYGEADDVPGLIRGLADGSEETRRESLDELFGNIYHQGTVYEATAFAVPFLLELVAERTVPDRGGILSLLQSISEGWLDCQRYAAEQGRFLPPAVAERHAQERPHYAAAHEAVARGIDVLSGLLTDDEPDVRVGAAFVLATLPERREVVALLLLDAIDADPDGWCRGALLIALLVLVQNANDAGLTEVAVRRFESVLAEGGSSFAALGAGVALLQLQREDAIPRVQELVRPRLTVDRDAFRKLPWARATELFSLVANSLSFSPREWLRWVVEGLGHADREVRDCALGCGVRLSQEIRWAAAELTPYYVRLVDDPPAVSPMVVVRYLADLGTPAVAALEGLARHPSADVRTEAGAQLERKERGRQDRASWLVEKRSFFLPSVSSLLRTIAQHGESRKWDDRQKVRQAVVNLGFHGPRAAPAADELRRLAAQDSPWVDVSAIRALWKITHDPAVVVPLIQASLRPEPAAFLLVDCLKQMGAAAGPLVPELRRIVDSDRRHLRSCDDVCSADDAFRHACAEAVQAIEAEAARGEPPGR